MPLLLQLDNCLLQVKEQEVIIEQPDTSKMPTFKQDIHQSDAIQKETSPYQQGMLSIETVENSRLWVSAHITRNPTPTCYSLCYSLVSRIMLFYSSTT